MPNKNTTIFILLYTLMSCTLSVSAEIWRDDFDAENPRSVASRRKRFHLENQRRILTRRGQTGMGCAIRTLPIYRTPTTLQKLHNHDKRLRWRQKRVSVFV